nr:hypothetical protein [uncultured Neokomagataea sp.]
MQFRDYVRHVSIFCAATYMSIGPVLAHAHGSALKHSSAINTFVEPMVTAHFTDGTKLAMRESVTGAHVQAAPALHYTGVGKVVQWWKDSTIAATKEMSLPDGTPLLHDPVTGASLGQFGAAYEIAGPMESGSASTPGGH